MTISSLETRLSHFAHALSDASRTTILCTLMDNRAYSATELATIINLAPSTTSQHLAILIEQQLIICVKQGRYRYFKLKDAETAERLEQLMYFSTQSNSHALSKTPKHLRYARTCYHHLAGKVAVLLHDQLMTLQWLNDTYQLTPQGQQALAVLGITVPFKPKSQQPIVCGCLDWSERRFHLGGQLGTALLSYFEKERWVERQLTHRALTFTTKGQQAFEKFFSLTLPVIGNT